MLLANIPGLDIPGNPDDKMLHFAAYSGLAIFAAKALPNMPYSRLLVVLTIFAAGIELVQFLMAQGRQANLMDFLAGVAGAAAALFIAFVVRRGKSVSDQTY